MPPLAYFLGLAIFLFAAGFVGVVLRRNALMIFMSLELMFNAANLVFVTFAAYYQVLDAQLFVFFIISIAAAEVAIGLALIVQIFRSKKSIDVDQMSQLKDEEYKEG